MNKNNEIVPVPVQLLTEEEILWRKYELQAFRQNFMRKVAESGQCLIGTFIDRSLPKMKGERGNHKKAQPSFYRQPSLIQKMSTQLIKDRLR